MSFNHLLTATAAAVLVAGLAGPQVSAAQPQTEGAAAAATGKVTTDAPANTSVQGTAQAVREGAAPAAAAAGVTAQPAGVQASAAAPTPRVTPAGDLVETARKSGQFKTFVRALEATNLTAVLKKNPNLTVFAPTDAAFAALPPGELDRLMADKAALQKLMTHHVINARVDSSKIKGAKGPVTTVANDAVELDGSTDVLRADNATIVQADVMASNGVHHVVDRVLMPGSAAASASAGAASGAAAPASATAAEPEAAGAASTPSSAPSAATPSAASPSARTPAAPATTGTPQ